MKYIVMLGDGMADYPIAELNGKTPLEAANTPYMDFLAQHGTVGMAKTVPEGMPPGSDTANLSVMGFDPKVYYTGRSPLEAVSMGIPLAADDVTFRCNLVTLSDDERLEDCTMLDYSSDEITTAESTALIAALDAEFSAPDRKLYPGISYRHCLVLHHAKTGTECTPPHDISLKPVASHLPQGLYADQLLDLMRRSREILREHPVNLSRRERGLNPANCCWFWGEGTKPALSSFEARYGIKGGVISAVDLIKGIGGCAGLTSIDVEGATGNVHTNFKGKADAAIALLRGDCDFVYIHIEAPDEAGHRFELDNKVTSIERIDRDVLGPVIEAMRADGEDFSVLLMPDHPTPLSLRTHTSEPVPFVLYRSDRPSAHTAPHYTEAFAAKTGVFAPEAFRLMNKLILDQAF